MRTLLLLLAACGGSPESSEPPPPAPSTTTDDTGGDTAWFDTGALWAEIDCAGDDALEENDLPELATALAPTKLTEAIACVMPPIDFDSDFYALTGSAGSTLTIDITFDHAEGDIDAFLELRGDFVAQGSSTDDNEQIVFTLPADLTTDEPIWLLVFGLDQSNPYTVQYTID